VVSAAAHPSHYHDVITVHAYPMIHIPPTVQQFSQAALAWLAHAVSDAHTRVADRGHRHSDGHSVTKFIVRYGLPRDAQGDSDAHGLPRDAQCDSDAHGLPRDAQGDAHGLPRDAQGDSDAHGLRDAHGHCDAQGLPRDAQGQGDATAQGAAHDLPRDEHGDAHDPPCDAQGHGDVHGHDLPRDALAHGDAPETQGEDYAQRIEDRLRELRGLVAVTESCRSLQDNIELFESFDMLIERVQSQRVRVVLKRNEYENYWRELDATFGPLIDLNDKLRYEYTMEGIYQVVQLRELYAQSDS